ncbi:MAG: hypothetical protein DRJ52_06760 [Thermoprotei archaeon]|nr:MAG: hypothetical protein DRJ52_06760 [Thermoprotei archaeon]RLF00364.1 MAG: hypothetical protein DRJ63_02785 [Thermoprotei archaeon]HDI74745.1 hypothetical protein [Thermoprotei archaeon]
MRLEAKKGNIIRVKGPASIILREGYIEYLGKSLREKERVSIPRGKVAFVNIIENSLLEINLGEDAEVEILEEIEDVTVPYHWRALIEPLITDLKKLPTKIMILGDVGTGKNLLATYITNLAVKRGYKVAILDKDVGQSSLSAPTTIGLVITKKATTSLHKVKTHYAYFVGSISPGGFVHRILVGAKLLLEKAISQKADLIVVNTDGWIHGKEAREYKWSLIDIVRPDYIIALQSTRELEHILKAYETQRWLEIIRIPSIKESISRDPLNRRIYRETAYKRKLAKSRIRTLNWSKVRFKGTIFGTGFRLEREKLKQLEKILGVPIVYAEDAYDALLIVTQEKVKLSEDTIEKAKRVTSRNDVLIVPKGYEKGLIVGLYDSQGSFLDIGVISEIDYKKEVIRILTNVEAEKIALIYVGNLKLGEDLSEKTKIYGFPL